MLTESDEIFDKSIRYELSNEAVTSFLAASDPKRTRRDLRNLITKSHLFRSDCSVDLSTIENVPDEFVPAFPLPVEVENRLASFQVACLRNDCASLACLENEACFAEIDKTTAVLIINLTKALHDFKVINFQNIK